MPIIVPCRSPGHQLLLRRETLRPEYRAAEHLERAFFPPLPLKWRGDPRFDLYGTSQKNHAAIADALNEEGDHSIRLSPYERGVMASYSLQNITKGTSLNWYIPYLPVLDPAGLYKLVRQSLPREGGGHGSFRLNLQEESFLAEQAIPAIVDTKIRKAFVEGENVIGITIKSLGIGIHGGGFWSVLKKLLDHLESRTDFDGAVSVDCIGFDADFFVLHSAMKYVSGMSRGIQQMVDSSPLRDRVQVRCDNFYGDLAGDIRLVAAMLAYGRTDLALWCIAPLSSEPEKIGDRYQEGIAAGIRANLQTPGALLVNQSASRHGGRCLVLRELKEG